MNLIPSVLILAAISAVHTEERHPEAVAVYTCDFEESSDVDFDHWPDTWTRRRGRGYPLYLKVEIADNPDEPLPTGSHCLRCVLNGGSIAAFSPQLDVRPEFSYILEAFVNAEGIRNDSIYYAISFFDEHRKLIETIQSTRVQNTYGWKPMRIGPVTPPRHCRFAQIGVHVEAGKQADLTGTVRFDDIWFGRFPLVTLQANSEHHIYYDASKVLIACEASGISNPDTMIDCELLDVRGERLAAAKIPLKLHYDDGSPVAATTGKSGGDRSENDEVEQVVTGKAEWKPVVKDFGFYQVRVSMPGRTGVMIERVLTFVVMPPNTTLDTGDFGWTLSNGDKPLPIKSLATLLDQVGIHWVKYPLWFGESTGPDDLPNQLASFIDRLDSHFIQVVGILDQPPDEIRRQYEDKGRMPIATLFVDSERWRPAIDPVMMRMSLKVRTWQLGQDNDTSFIEFPNLEPRIQDIKQYVSRFGQDIALGFSWDLTNDLPIAKNPSWSFLALTADPEFTSTEVQDYLQNRQFKSQRWLTIRPLPRNDYHLDTRVHDLVCRMVTAKIAGADVIFAADPFDPETGLMRFDGQPGELLLPWRNTATMLSGTDYIGTLSLPGGSQNHLFARGNEAMLVVWSDVPTTERLYLGDSIKQFDVWGSECNVGSGIEDGLPFQSIEVGRLPTFVKGVNLPIAKWRKAFRFDTDRLISVFGREQTLSYEFTNDFTQSVGGEMTVHVPPNWDIFPHKTTFKLAPGEVLKDSLSVVLRADAHSGVQPLRIDFQVTADRDYRFSVYGNVNVGLDDVTVELTTRMDDEGNLIVDQHLVNSTDRFLDFDCQLFIPDRRRLRRQISNLGPGRTTVSYVLPNARELLGKTFWLRLEELGGPRVINQQVVAEE